MGEVISILGGILAIIVALVTIMRFLFYSKAQVDERLKENTTSLESKLHEELVKLSEDNKHLKEVVSEHKLQVERERLSMKDVLHEKLDETKLALEDAMKEFIGTLTDIKQSDKEMTIQFITLVNTVKDELKNDYTARYNDLLAIINSKANESDFNRLESKFDKISESIIELKTIFQHQLEKKEKH